MKKLESCSIDNCIPSPSSCVEWNGGDIDALGICNGDSLDNVIWEIITKLQELAGEELSGFDIDGLLDICNQKAPLEINLLSILTILGNNEICLKDYINTLNDKINELSTASGVNVNLRCYADFDNLGNALSVTRESLDQLVINELCNHKQRLESVEGKLTLLESEINNIEATSTVEELAFSTCVDAGVKSTSVQVIKVATELCNLQTATGNPAHIAAALSKTPSDFNTKFGLISGWDLSPDDWAQNYGNLLLAFNNLLSRIETIEQTCCALTCDDVKLGFTAVFNEDETGVIIKFTSGAGTIIPAGFIDKGSTGTITDVDGNVETFSIAIANGSEDEISISGLNLTEDLVIDIEAKLGTDSLTCEKCLNRKVKSSGCGYCEITASGDANASAVIVYKTVVDTSVITGEETTSSSTSTTSSSTTTTTTEPL